MERDASDSGSSPSSPPKSPTPLLQPSRKDTKRVYSSSPITSSAPPVKPAQNTPRATVPGAVASVSSNMTTEKEKEITYMGGEQARRATLTGRTQSQTRIMENRVLGRKMKKIQKEINQEEVLDRMEQEQNQFVLQQQAEQNRVAPSVPEQTSTPPRQPRSPSRSSGESNNKNREAEEAVMEYKTEILGRQEMARQEKKSRVGPVEHLPHQRGYKEGLIALGEKKPVEESGLYRDDPRFGGGRPGGDGQVPTNDFGPEERLAVAVAVTEEERAALNHLPVGIEYDPDAKPPIHRNRRFQMYAAAVAFLLCVALVTTGVLLVLNPRNEEGSSSNDLVNVPTPSPTTQDEALFKEQIARSVTYRVYLEGTPQWDAVDWIMNRDPLRLEPSAPNLIQRFVLALFYIKTTQGGPWRSCNPNNSTLDNDCIYDRLYRNELDELAYRQESQTAWLSSEHECKWVGVGCDSFDTVRTIELWGQNLTGTLPTELSALPFMTSVSLAYNELIGRLPIDYANMKHLINLELHGNSLSGEIPDSFFYAVGLKGWTLQENELSGTISTKIGLMTNLKGVHFGKNKFEGTIPTEVGLLTELGFSRWNNNQFSGAIPIEFGHLTKLQELWLHVNQLTGTLPSELGSLEDVGDLRIFANSLDGTIPEQIYSLTNLWRLDLMDMDLSGTISTRIGQLQNLQEFRVRRNKLVGTVPTEIGLLKDLRLLWVHLTLLEGAMPSEICANVEPGALRYLQSDCGPVNGPTPPAAPCDCCDGCCDRDTGICLITENDDTNQFQSPNPSRFLRG